MGQVSVHAGMPRHTDRDLWGRHRQIDRDDFQRRSKRLHQTRGHGGHEVRARDDVKCGQEVGYDRGHGARRPAGGEGIVDRTSRTTASRDCEVTRRRVRFDRHRAARNRVASTRHRDESVARQAGHTQLGLDVRDDTHLEIDPALTQRCGVLVSFVYESKAHARRFAPSALLERAREDRPDRVAAPNDQLPREMLEGNGERRGALAKFDQCPEAPALGAVTRWSNTEAAMGTATSLAELRGKIVVLDFWATWCGPCIASIPKLNALSEKYADKGVVIIGVCHPEGGEKMLDTAKTHKIAYPICLDARGEANKAYTVDGYPDFFIIDREGRLRGADVINARIEDAIEHLLAEEVKK